MLAINEAVRPVCSPAYAAEHERTLAGPVAGWSGLTFLGLLRPNEGWTSWEDWFSAAGSPAGTPRRLGLDSYSYMLESTAVGNDIALGSRYFIDRQLEAGALVALGDEFVEFDRAYYGVLTEKGRRKPLACRCLAFFAWSELPAMPPTGIQSSLAAWSASDWKPGSLARHFRRPPGAGGARQGPTVQFHLREFAGPCPAASDEFRRAVLVLISLARMPSCS